MHYGAIKFFDIANGVGVRVSLFVSGCTNHCKNCFQPLTWDFDYGDEFTDETEKSIIEALSSDYIEGLSVLGGEPFEPRNQEVLVDFLKRVKAKYPNKTIWMYSGFTYEELKEQGNYSHTSVTDEILKTADVLVDGRFCEELKDLSLKFRGSSNQRIIDLNRTASEGKIVLLEV